MSKVVENPEVCKSATVLQFPAARWLRFRKEPCPIHPEGRLWRHAEALGDGTFYCRAADIFCRHDARRRAICTAELGERPDGTPLAHGDVVGGRHFCGRKNRLCECGHPALCARSGVGRVST